MSHALQRIDETREALMDALAARNWDAIGELDLGCRAVIDEALTTEDVARAVVKPPLASLQPLRET